MAASVSAFSLLRVRLAQPLFLRGSGRSSTVASLPKRTAVTTSTGALYPKPEKVSFGLLRVFSVVVPFLYLGTLISKNFAALLEEHDIFVPEDDDDDD
ncbi:essential MCU regulator, mitochondrial [Hyperolius riggenbachi]|uniref:essential MCU regulator, mitochondrial n=1 Tax=Hyperolius riggenbachi TaxID=752182 RepID=UPI0035A2F420